MINAYNIMSTIWVINSVCVFIFYFAYVLESTETTASEQIEVYMKCFKIALCLMPITSLLLIFTMYVNS